MPRCDRCDDPIDMDGDWFRLSHHRPHMSFASRFCCAECAVAYLEDGLGEQ